MHPFIQMTVPEGAAAVHRFEQSSFAIRDAGGTLTLLDPYSPHDRPPDDFIHSTPPMNEVEWPADFVLLTHVHSDHTHPETLTRLHKSSPRTRYVGPQESIDLILADTPIPASQCTAVAAADSVKIGTTTVHVVYSKLPGGDPDADIKPPDTTHLGFVIEAGRQRLYFSGDPIYTFAEHESLTGPIAALEPTVGFLTNHPTEGEFPSFDGCVLMAIRCRVRTACPSHYDCFVTRDYDPSAWEVRFPDHGPLTHIIPRNGYTIFGA